MAASTSSSLSAGRAGAGAGAGAGERAVRFTELREKNLKIILYLTSGSYLDGLTENQKRVVRSQAKNYTYDEARAELYYTGSKPYTMKRVIVEEDEAIDILKQYHSSETGGHSGINTTLSKISMSYTWNGMKQDVVDFIKSCDRCQRHDKIKTQVPELKSINATEPLQLVGMDLIGPLPTTQEGYKYVLTFTDYFTKFVEFFPLKSKEASSIASSIQTFVYRWGAPTRLLSDQGREFVAKINGDLCKKLGIARSVTSAYHPQMNGLDERTNHTLQVRLSKLVNDHQDDWANYLDRVAYSIRTQKQTSTKYTPFFLMFGRHPRAVLEMEPTDNDVTLPLSEADTEDVDEAVCKREEMMAATNSKVKQNVAAAQSKQKMTFKRRQSKGVKTFHFSVGDFVLRRNCKNAGRKGGKMEQLWTGPYRYGIKQERRADTETLHRPRPTNREKT